MQTMSGYGRKPNGPSASPGRYASAAWPMSAGSADQKNSIPLSIKKKNAHTNAPAMDPVAMTQSTKSARLMGLEKLVMRLRFVEGRQGRTNATQTPYYIWCGFDVGTSKAARDVRE